MEHMPRLRPAAPVLGSPERVLSSACIEMGFFVRTFQNRFCEFFASLSARGDVCPTVLRRGSRRSTTWCSSTGYREWMWKICSIHRDHPPRSRGLTKCNPCNGSRHVHRGIRPPSCSTSGAIHRVWAAGSRPRSRCHNSLGHTRPCSKAQWPRRLLMGTCTGCKGTPWK